MQELIRKTLNLTAVVLLMITVMLAGLQPSASAASVTINSPANGQTFSGNEFILSGSAEANAAITIINNKKVLAQTRADSNGIWSVSLSGLPDGNNNITAKAVTNSGYGYFMGFAPNSLTASIYQLRLRDNAINVSPGFPIADPTQHVVIQPSPGTDLYYLSGTVGQNSQPPSQFRSSNPATPVVASGDYPEDGGANVGAFTQDGSKYFSPNLQANSVTVIDTASNAVVDNIELGAPSLTAWLSPDGRIFVNRGDHKVTIVDPATNSIIKTLTIDCTGFTPSTIFSRNPDYPYYFVSCSQTEGSSKMIKYLLASDEVVDTILIGVAPTVGIFSANDSKLYVNSSAAFSDNTNADKIFVYDIESKALTKTIQLTDGAIGFFYSPNGQHLYVSTPGAGFNKTGFDIVDMLTDTVEHVATNTVIFGMSLGSESTTLSQIDVAVVLGVESSIGQLAKTGIILAVATPLGLLLVVAAVYTFYDYRRHRKPLLEVDEGVDYSYLHHLRMVSIPLVRYRLSFSISRLGTTTSKKVRRF